MTGRPRKTPIAYTDTQLTYCPKCAAELDLLSKTAMPINWLPFGPIDDVDDPGYFYRVLVEMVDRKQGRIDDVTPPSRS